MEKRERLDGPHSAYGYKWRSYNADVYKELDSDTGKYVAVKEAYYVTGVPRRHKYAEIEAFILGGIKNHPNVIRLEGFTKWKGFYIFYLEYIEFNLEQFIKPPCNPISPILRKEYLRQILSGIVRCHSHGITHRHLEPRFVMVDHDKETVKISEFGEARTIRCPRRNSRLVDHNGGYRAPEVILGPRFFPATDVWAIGCIFAEMVLHKPLFQGVTPDKSLAEQMLPIFRLLGRPVFLNPYPAMEAYFDSASAGDDLFDSLEAKDLRSEPWGCFGIEDTGLDLLLRMLTFNPKDRITAAEALNHPYFTETSTDTKMLGKRKFEEISGDVGLECGEGTSMSSCS